MNNKHILIVSIDYPPNPSIGSRRISAISRELYNNGFIPHIVTANNPNLKFKKDLEIPSELIHYVKWWDIWALKKILGTNIFSKYLIKLISFFFPISSNTVPERRLNFWIKPAIKECLDIINKYNIELIYSSYNPPASVRVAAAVKNVTRIPWINEYRDLWSGNPYLAISKKRVKLNWELEKSLIKNVDALITVSEPIKLDLIKLHNKPTYVVYNGIDNIKVENINSKKEDDIINIVYTGIIYKGKRDPKALFKALQLLKIQNIEFYKKLSIDFYGANMNDILGKDVIDFGLEDIINLHESVSHKKIIEIQAKADIFLLLGWNNIADEGVVTGKVFEYLFWKKPILALGYADGAMDSLLHKTNTGSVINDPKAICEYLIGLESVIKSEKQLKDFKNQVRIAPYYRSNQMKSLISIFKQTIEKNNRNNI